MYTYLLKCEYCCGFKTAMTVEQPATAPAQGGAVETASEAPPQPPVSEGAVSGVAKAEDPVAMETDTQPPSMPGFQHILLKFAWCFRLQLIPVAVRVESACSICWKSSDLKSDLLRTEAAFVISECMAILMR